MYFICKNNEGKVNARQGGDAFGCFSYCQRKSMSCLGFYLKTQFFGEIKRRTFLAPKNPNFCLFFSFLCQHFTLREDYCFYLMPFWGKSLSCLLHPAHTHTKVGELPKVPLPHSAGRDKLWVFLVTRKLFFCF